MSARWRSLRVRLALLGFAAIYLPAVVLFAVTIATDERVTQTDGAVQEVRARETTGPSGWAIATLIALAPTAGGLAWWLAGRAVRPIERVQAVAEDIEASDLSRRIGLRRGPTEVVSLAASFDAMLDRLEQAASAQRRLIEEISHDLRTPLAVLATNADVLLAHPQPSLEVYRDGIERSRGAALRLQSTIEALLVDARGRARTIDRRPSDLVALVRAVVDDAAVLADAGGVTVTCSGPPAASCRLDEDTVRRAVANLIDNAVRHAPGATVVVHVDVTDDEASVVVADDGPGVAADRQERIFERFWSNDREGAGTGLGLPIARQIALAHGGDITVRSPGPSGTGAVFTLRLRR
jgi:signal transduction histidine kinase